MIICFWLYVFFKLYKLIAHIESFSSNEFRTSTKVKHVLNTFDMSHFSSYLGWVAMQYYLHVVLPGVSKAMRLEMLKVLPSKRATVKWGNGGMYFKDNSSFQDNFTTKVVKFVENMHNGLFYVYILIELRTYIIERTRL